ncbi:uncharacterized protein METZ01_LOCUS272765 [marine metagenome]|uniref:DUF2905 domain-containing protein n=1 Tax=marine metagenome TaxID=408172 RepID=A0A382KB03_9ZZZZ
MLMSKIIITIGECFITVGLIIHLFGDKMGWFGNLYGDIKIVKSNYGFYFPITSMIIISIVLTLALNFFSRFFK